MKHTRPVSYTHLDVYKRQPQGFLRTDAGENANKGLDGVYPLVAGACTARQHSTALAHLKSTKELFSPVGLTACLLYTSRCV